MTSVVNALLMRAAFVLLSICLLQACADGAPSFHQLSGYTMGTSYHITVVEGAQPIDKTALQARIDQLLKQVNQQMSTYIDDSELVQLNRAATNQWIALSQPLFDVLQLSLEVSWLTAGAFDITVGPLVDLWGFGPGEQRDTQPDAQAIAALLQNTGFQQLEFDLQSNSLLKRAPVRLDLSAIAKGWGVDQVASLLRAEGIASFMVEIGGELYLQGSNPHGKPWRIAIEQPGEQLGAVYQAVALSGHGMATSGDYRNYFEQDGVRYSHTIDPQTGRPITHRLASVTVIADTTAYADALATAINVMGAERGLALAQQQGLAVYLIEKTDAGFVSKYSDAFAPFLN